MENLKVVKFKKKRRSKDAWKYDCDYEKGGKYCQCSTCLCDRRLTQHFAEMIEVNGFYFRTPECVQLELLIRPDLTEIKNEAA